MKINRIKLVTELTLRNLTQTELARQAGLGRETICKIKGGKNCTYETGCKLAKALDMPLEDLLEKF